MFSELTKSIHQNLLHICCTRDFRLQSFHRFSYVSVSRGKYDTQIYTDSKNKLARGLSRNQLRPTAIQTEEQSEVGQREESKAAHRRAHEQEQEQAQGIGLGGA